MSIQGTPLDKSPYDGWVISPDDVREFLRDYPDKNPLVDGVEFSDKDVEKAIKRTISMGNVTARPTTYTVTNFPNDYVLLMGEEPP